MNLKPRTVLASVLACLLLITAFRPAQGDNLKDVGAQVVGASIGIGVVIGVGIYFLVRKGPSITGCAVSTATGLAPAFELKDEQSQRTYTLAGELGNIHAGERVRVYGKKQKRDSNSGRFLVKRLPKELGPCKVLPNTP